MLLFTSPNSETLKACTRRLEPERSRVPLSLLNYYGLSHMVVAEFTGISAPYEAPEGPEIHIRTDESNVEESVRIITEYLSRKSFI